MDDLVGEGVDVGGVVGDEQDRQREARLQLAQLGAQAAAQRHVERRERLVEQQRARLGGERTRQRRALALAARELVGEARRRAGAARARRASARPPRRRRRGAGCASPCRGRRRRSGARSDAETARTPGTRSRAGAARAGRSMPAAASNSVSPSKAMRPCVGPQQAGDRLQASASCRRPTGRTAPGARRRCENATSSSKRVRALAHRSCGSRPPTSCRCAHELPGCATARGGRRAAARRRRWPR